MNDQKAISLEKGKIYHLPRGGYIIDTSEGYLQVGSPPETIKDSLFFEKGVPGIFCLPKHFFSREKGISVAEVEFPIYYNFFLKQRKTKLICHKSQIDIFKRVIREALFGPQKIDIKKDYIEGTTEMPNLFAEMSSFVAFKFEDLVEFIPIQEDQPVLMNNLIINISKNEDFEVIDREFKLKTTIPSVIDYNVIYDIGQPLSKPFQPPQMGVTCLGPSHGFDPKDNTSGFIIWLGGNGIMIDPPVNSTEWLMRSNVNPKLIDSIILTHTHADHDAGTLQKILEEERITIYTTQTVMNSWLYKYSTLTQIPEHELMGLFDFVPVHIGEKINIKGAWFSFRYMLHSIPTVGFDFHFRKKSFTYSSDHLNSQEKFDELLEKKIISKARHQEFISFPWHHDIIYHESGFAPLHTPVALLDQLPSEVKKKTTIYHIAAKDVPENTELTLAKFGISNSLIIDVEDSSFYHAYQIVDLISRVDLFKDFSLSKTKDLLSSCETLRFPKGKRVITQGEYEENFYVILSGSLVLYKDEKKDEVTKRFGRCQYLGEVSLMTNSARSVNIYAETEVEVIAIKKNAFLKIISGTKAEKKLRNIVDNRDMQSWQALSSTDFFEKLTSSQKTELELLLKRKTIEKDTYLIKTGELLKSIYLFFSGEGKLENPTEGVDKKLETGDIIGIYSEFLEGLPSTYSCKIKKDSLVFEINQKNFKTFIKNNPGIFLRFIQSQKKTFA